MTFVSGLVEAAAGDSTSVSSLLRQVKVLASRLRVVDLASWVEHELVGYPESAQLPSYRGPHRADVQGHFSGGFGSEIQNAPIPPSAFAQDLREKYRLFHVEFRQPVAELEDLAGTDKLLRAHWPADIIVLTNSLMASGKLQLYPHHGLQQAWQVIPPGTVKGILDTVRTRVLDLALSLEQEFPDAGESVAPVAPEDPRLQRIVTNIYGGNAQVAVASSHVQQSITYPAQGDRTALFDLLTGLGVEPGLMDELTDALDEQELHADQDLLPRVKTLLGNLLVTGAQASTTAAGAMVGEVAAKAVLGYLGIGG